MRSKRFTVKLSEQGERARKLNAELARWAREERRLERERAARDEIVATDDVPVELDDDYPR